MKDYTKMDRLLAGAIKRMRQRLLSMAWEKWQCEYAQAKSAEATRFKLSGAIRRMMMRKLSMAWEKWQFWYFEIIAQKRLLESAMRKFMRYTHPHSFYKLK